MFADSAQRYISMYFTFVGQLSNHHLNLPNNTILDAVSHYWTTEEMPSRDESSRLFRRGDEFNIITVQLMVKRQVVEYAVDEDDKRDRDKQYIHIKWN